MVRAALVLVVLLFSLPASAQTVVLRDSIGPDTSMTDGQAGDFHVYNSLGSVSTLIFADMTNAGSYTVTSFDLVLHGFGPLPEVLPR